MYVFHLCISSSVPDVPDWRGGGTQRDLAPLGGHTGMQRRARKVDTFHKACTVDTVDTVDTYMVRTTIVGTVAGPGLNGSNEANVNWEQNVSCSRIGLCLTLRV